MNQEELAKIRRFNRDYVLILGILNNSMKDLDYSLTEGRVIFEVGNGSHVIANQLATKLHIDRSYLNRLINKLAKDGLLSKTASESDNRVKILNLTTQGRKALREINHQNDLFTSELFSQFSADERHKIINSMELITNRLL
ncbi:MarR family transcriptional regulator [Paucilactobacillus suebicus]|uniref:HTH marR-type domain-containing protein n=1 Tax=Paucilactobacillus suebicus DSM 5007 = KCTC 3549 TaxID=1423807 RepID=A0A0R1WA64_9LACO|nr:MarR family transcriptional regulator [Paucilactobacillus suebicus]KRM11974.1 hypothetical protein FD16_GL000342 [Paucilactobacillus suebicus DSM 5007 = KCTC 3549]